MTRSLDKQIERLEEEIAMYSIHPSPWESEWVVELKQKRDALIARRDAADDPTERGRINGHATEQINQSRGG
jgi:hypothetical protein